MQSYGTSPSIDSDLAALFEDLKSFLDEVQHLLVGLEGRLVYRLVLDKDAVLLDLRRERFDGKTTSLSASHQQ